MSYEITPEVEEIGKIHIEGNITPSHWYKVLTFENGKPNFISVILLSDIFYWYRPSIKEDEESGQVVSVRKKLKCDFLQRSTKAFSKKFGFSQKQVRDSLRFLEDRGLIKRHFRTVDHGEDLISSNVQFIEIIHEAIFTLSSVKEVSK